MVSRGFVTHTLINRQHVLDNTFFAFVWVKWEMKRSNLKYFYQNELYEN